MTIRSKLECKSNDYTNLEPFENDSPIKSSILIPAYNEEGYLKNTIKAINNAIEYSNNPNFFELIIVDDGSKKDLTTILENEEICCKKVFHRFQKNRGRSLARNKAIELSSNELIFFFDSDVLIQNNYFNEHWKIHNKTRNAIAVGLAENIYGGDRRINRFLSENAPTPDIKKDFRIYKDISKWADENSRKEFHLLNETNNFKHWGNNKKIDFWTLPYMVVSHNMSVLSENVEEVNGFDERFKGWGCEDSFFGAKLISSGGYVIPVLNSSAYRIKHPPREGDENQRKKEMMNNMDLYELLLDEKC